MNDAAKVIGLDRKPVEIPKKAPRPRRGFREWMILFWRVSLVFLSVATVASLGSVLAWFVRQATYGPAEAFAMVLASCFLLGLALSCWDRLIRTPREVHHFHVVHERWEDGWDG